MALTFRQVVAQAVEWLQQDQRVSYRALKRQFALDDDWLADLKAELVDIRCVAVDHDGAMLVWIGPSATGPPSGEMGRPPAVAEARPLPPGPPAEPRTPDAERRQLTVMFCDLVGSTPLSGQLDPEDLREVVRAYQRTCAEVIQRFDGHVRQFLGDALLVYFGWPYAHEDDARRAVRSALGMLDAMAALNENLERDKRVRLAIRVGIHTGLVVVGEMGSGRHHEHLALGNTPNIAARLQDRAEPDTVIISEATFRLVRGHFAVEPLGPQSLRGVAEPVEVYRVAGENVDERHGRMEMPGGRGLRPLVGRESEVALLAERWAQSRDGRGQVVVLSGEAGIGKSRLVQALYERAAGEGVCIVLRCSPYYTNSALYPVIEHVQHVMDVSRDDTAEVRVAKLERVLERARVPLNEAVPLLAAMLAWPHPGPYPAVELSAERQRQKTQEILLTWLLAETERQPVLAVWEDLHWADPSTLELLGAVLDQSPTASMLSVLTCRPEFHPPWSPRSHLAQLTLNRLTRPQVIEMARRLSGGKTLPDPVVEQIVTKTDGVPLFIEEMTKAILESGHLAEAGDRHENAGSLPTVAIPTTLHDSLMARLDRLVTAKTLAQHAAVIGRHFSYAVLRAVSELDERTLARELARLVDAELLYQRGLPPHATYMFKHALIRDAAYQSLLKRTRQQHHHRIAQVLAEQFPEVGATQPELLAHHLTEAGLAEQALGYWIQAGQNAVARSANAEAIGQLIRALEVLRTLPDTTARAQQELTIHMAMGPALIATTGYGTLQVHETYARARELCHQLGDTVRLFPVLRGLWNRSLMRADHQETQELGEQLLDLATRLGDPGNLVEAHRALGTVLWNMGELLRAHDQLSRGIALYDPRRHRSLAFVYGADPGVVCRLYDGIVLWTLGYPERGGERMREALSLASGLSHPHSVAFAFVFAALLERVCGDTPSAREHAHAAVQLASEHGIAQWLAAATVLLGSVLAVEGEHGAGIDRIHHGMAAWRAASAEILRPVWLALLAGACRDCGDYRGGVRALDEALTLISRTKEHWYEPEVLRLKGELMLALSPDDRDDAQACFERALAIARQQVARSWELRISVSLSRLWQRHGQVDDARRLLAPVLDWFTEGLHTPDLAAARKLLESLPG
jgi:class 3 adenylate cyclase/predicted ATPase/tRNA A37 threonylcarbamoyladenosine biosynthesis protein TsaE